MTVMEADPMKLQAQATLTGGKSPLMQRPMAAEAVAMMQVQHLGQPFSRKVGHPRQSMAQLEDHQLDAQIASVFASSSPTLSSCSSWSFSLGKMVQICRD